jgi:ribonuclease HII
MIGVDEVGRGAIAGPLLVCAVRLNKPVEGLKDSKLLSKKKREGLAAEIKQNADIGYGWVSAQTIDDIGLSESLILATAKALEEVSPRRQEEVIIDGSVNFVPDLNSKTIIRGDQTVPAVSAASIIAKVTRDNLMCQLAIEHPQYGFEKHVGYGSKKHLNSIKNNGFCAVHRKSFKLKTFNV